MENLLMDKLRAYVLINNPDLVVRLQENHGFRQFLRDKVELVRPLLDELLAQARPGYVIEELCLTEMTADLRPSRFNYVREVLETEFPAEFEGFSNCGVLTYETINMVEACRQVFDDFDFNEANEDNRHLRYAVISKLHDYMI